MEINKLTKEKKLLEIQLKEIEYKINSLNEEEEAKKYSKNVGKCYMQTEDQLLRVLEYKEGKYICEIFYLFEEEAHINLVHRDVDYINLGEEIYEKCYMEFRNRVLKCMGLLK